MRVRQERKPTKQDPVTPDKWQDVSKRNWEGQVKKWRRQLHAFDLDSPVKLEEYDGRVAAAAAKARKMHVQDENQVDNVATQ